MMKVVIALAALVSFSCNGGSPGPEDPAVHADGTPGTDTKPGCFCNVTTQCDPQCTCDPDCSNKKGFGAACQHATDCRDEDNGPESPTCHDNRCTRTCTYSVDCPKTTGCREIGTDRICTWGELSPYKGPCNNAADCKDEGYGSEAPQCVLNMCSRSCKYTADCPLGTSCQSNVCFWDP